ncbi:hypothetical protein D3C78_1002020 [compost metagenome]
MGLVVAGDGGDHAALHRLAQAVAVGAGTQRRLHVVEAGEVDQRLVGEDQLVHRHIGGDRQAAGLGLGDQLGAAGAGDLAEVGAHAALLHQQQVAGQGHGFGGFRNAGQAQEAGGRAFVGQAAFGQGCVLGVEDHGQVEGGGVFQRAALHAVAGEGGQAVAEGHAADVAQGHQLGQLLAGQALGQGADGEDLGVAGFLGTVEDQLGHRRGVQHRTGQGRAAEAGDAAAGGRQGFAGDIALAAVAGLAQGDVEVHQAGRGHQALGVYLLVALETGRGLAEGGHLAAFEEEVGDLVVAAGRVDQAGTEDVGTHQFSSSASWFS